MTEQLSTHRESDDGYMAVVACLNDRWRVILCKDGIQWILQRAKKRWDGTAWEGCRYCRTRKALIRSCAELVGEIDPIAMATVERLPEICGHHRHGGDQC